MKNKRVLGTLAVLALIGGLYIITTPSGDTITGNVVASSGVKSIGLLLFIVTIAIFAMFVGEYDWVKKNKN